MKYSIPPKAIRYKGIVFRSKLEARCYDYLLNTIMKDRSLEIEYEPDLPFITSWNPDFGIYRGSELVYLIEVKPESRMFDVIRYIIKSTELGDRPEIICMDSCYSVYFDYEGGFKIIPYNELIWKQTFNNVNFESYE